MSLPTFTHEYRDVVDRSTWGPGPWDGEPDKAVWVDEATGLDCMVRRGNGAWCGYVGVPPAHPWHHKDYSECVTPGCDGATDWDGEDEYHYECTPQGRVEVHGGLTFAGECDDEGDPAKAICHIPEPGRHDDVTWFGFDCNHGWDLNPAMCRYAPMPGAAYRDLAYVVAETQRLAAQLAEVSS